MRIVSLLVVLSSLSIVCAQGQEEKPADPSQGQQKTPTTLTEAHAELERVLSPETLAEIDAMPSEDGMIKYHFGLGLNIRNGWGLWAGGPLAKHMQSLGFTHPDEMSGVILNTFWCKRHGKGFRIEERAASSRACWEAQRNIEQEKTDRIQKANVALRDMMMGLRFEKPDVPVVQMPIQRGLTVRFMCPFRGGVFLTAYCQGSISSNQYIVTEGSYADPVTGVVRRRPDMDDSVARGFCKDPGAREPRRMKPGEDFYTLGFHLDLTDHKIHRICVPEVNEVYAAVVAGNRAWFAGLTDGKVVLAGLGAQDRITAPLPQEDEVPDLGMDGPCLLAVYAKTIYRLVDREWTLVHSGDILLPRSGLPPQRQGNMIFLRDEGRGEVDKRLWWLSTNEKPHLRLFARDLGLFDPVVRERPRAREIHSIGYREWGETSSYCVTSNGDLWACVGAGSFLFRRSKDGIYSAATANHAVEFTGGLLDKRQTDQDVSLSAVTALPDNTLLLAGETGLYRLTGSELIQELAFDNAGKSWTPNTVLALDDGSYVIGSAMWDGVYLLRKADDGQWSCLAPERTRETVVW